MNTSTLLWSLLFGSVGLAYVVYGRRQRMVAPFVAGLALIATPYFVSSTAAMLVIGMALMAAPFFFRG